MSQAKAKETVGKISLDLLQKDPPTRDPIELEREMHKDYEANIYECISRGQRDCSGDFYVVVLTKTERLLSNVIRNYLFYRNSCPTPEYDQTVYRYDKKDKALEFLWVIPSEDACIYLKINALLVDKSEHDLLRFVLDFYDGTLDRKVKRLNNEEYKSSFLLNAQGQ